MKKKKLNGLSLNKNVISRLNSRAIMGGDPLMSKVDCPTGIYYTCPDPGSGMISADCGVQTDNCGHTEQSCESVHIHCN